MKKNIAIALNAGTPEQRNAITSYFSSQKLAYWHWIDDFWIVQVDEDVTPKSLHITIEQLDEIGKPTVLMFEFKGRVKYFGRANKAAWDWLSHIGNVE
jgi:hypothetical protein